MEETWFTTARDLNYHINTCCLFFLHCNVLEAVILKGWVVTQKCVTEVMLISMTLINISF